MSTRRCFADRSVSGDQLRGNGLRKGEAASHDSRDTQYLRPGVSWITTSESSSNASMVVFNGYSRVLGEPHKVIHVTIYVPAHGPYTATELTCSLNSNNIGFS
jgi:hypothetical protein